MKSLRRIFALVPDCHARHGYYGRLWRRHFYEGIQTAASDLVVPEAVDFSWARPVLPGQAEQHALERSATCQQLWEQIQAAHRQQGLDAVISCCFAQDLETRLVGQVIGLGVPWINFFCDSTHRFTEVERLAREVSLNWFPEHAAIAKYRDLGVPFVCRPYALNPACLPDLSCRFQRHGVGFVGLPTSNRVTQLGWLRLLGCRVEIHGRGWQNSPENGPGFQVRLNRRLLDALRQPHLWEKIARRLFWPMIRRQAHGELDEAGFSAFVSECQIMLGLNQAPDDQGHLSSYLKFRDLEFPGYGCCYLTEQNPDIAAALEVDREVLTYRSITEAARRIRQILRNPQQAQLVGQASRRRVLACHTWIARLPELTAHLENP